MSFQFKVTRPGQMQFVSNESVGVPGFISVSTVPGDFSGSPECSQGGSGASMWITYPPVGGCPLTLGTYYLNFTTDPSCAIDPVCNPFCGPPPCSKVGYSEYASGP